MSDESNLHRRATDRMQEDLDAMVAAENDPRARATLMCLNALNRSIAENTAVTYELKTAQMDHSEKFNKHVENFKVHAEHEEALLNKGRGAWFVLAWVLAIVQSVVGYYMYDAHQTSEKMKERIIVLEQKKSPN